MHIHVVLFVAARLDVKDALDCEMHLISLWDLHVLLSHRSIHSSIHLSIRSSLHMMIYIYMMYVCMDVC